MLYGGCEWAIAREQAITPGEESFGVAVLGMLFLPLILATSALTIAAFLASAFLARRQRRKPN